MGAVGTGATELVSVGVWIFQIYLILGVLAAIALEIWGLEWLDPAVDESSRGFRVLIFPGLVAFWPVFIKRWISGSDEPPEEYSAHRVASANDRSEAE